MTSETREQRNARMNREREDRMKAIRKRARKERRDTWLVRGAIGVGVVAAIFAAIALGAVIFQAFVWNLGVVGLAAACGATVSKIGFWTAFGAVWLTTTLKSIISGTDSVSAKFNKE